MSSAYEACLVYPCGLLELGSAGGKRHIWIASPIAIYVCFPYEYGT